MAVSSLSLSWVPRTFKEKLNEPRWSESPPSGELPLHHAITCLGDHTAAAFDEESNCKRRPLLLGAIGSLTASLLPASSLLAQEMPANYQAFVDLSDGYSYYYPSDWREFDFRGHDSAFKDRYLQLQNVRVRFIPTDKQDIHDMGPMDEVVSNLVKNIYAAPNQIANIFYMQERTVDGKDYYTFEYELRSSNFASCSFATIAVANGRFYTLTVAANERRWRRVRNKLKVVADSFKVLDI
ncbi:photosynthetic NDH subunit of lumenal location 1, chloroplastic isoform X2 [Rhodamnia argentea]|uniref:Photosynthetic NDH subunit of lumenal location 1, chloroplastic isoform X2 n=1 Tax=Rhodamnia argentea TaxID=178133 RepID=A0A8B8MPR1_9MYRT|nr:photosynthetic NDH subunit of lumenal location 1, chloroplastic isoform X2 [Rhodamnia argentea]